MVAKRSNECHRGRLGIAGDILRGSLVMWTVPEALLKKRSLHEISMNMHGDYTFDMYIFMEKLLFD